MTKRKDGLWQDYIKLKGMLRPKYFYGRTKAEIKRKMNEWQEEYERGAKFETVADAWWEEHEPKLAYYTARSYRPARNRAVEAFGDEYIRDITPAMINTDIKHFAKNHADKTVRTQLGVYNMIFKYAVAEGYVLFNPARALSVPSNLPKRKVTSPSADDLQRVKDSTGCTFGMFAYWLLYTGLRRGELLALTWGDVDIIERTIVVNKAIEHVSNRPRLKGTKTKASAAVLPIIDRLAVSIKPGKCIIFPNENSGYLSETQFQRQWELYTRESGVTCTPHQLRHAFATMLFEAGVPERDAQELLRHAQLATTMDIYTDLRDQQRKKIHAQVYSVDIV